MFEVATNRRDGSFGNGISIVSKAVSVGYALGPNPGDTHLDINFLFKLDGPAIVAGCVYAREADLFALNFADDAQPQAPQKRVLGFFHIRMENGEMNDSGHVRISKLNTTPVVKRLGHWFAAELNACENACKEKARQQSSGRLSSVIMS